MERKNIFIVYIITDLNSYNTDDRHVEHNFKLELFSIGALGLEFIGRNVWDL